MNNDIDHFAEEFAHGGFRLTNNANVSAECWGGGDAVESAARSRSPSLSHHEQCELFPRMGGPA